MSHATPLESMSTHELGDLLEGALRGRGLSKDQQLFIAENGSRSMRRRLVRYGYLHSSVQDVLVDGDEPEVITELVRLHDCSLDEDVQTKIVDTYFESGWSQHWELSIEKLGRAAQEHFLGHDRVTRSEVEDLATSSRIESVQVEAIRWLPPSHAAQLVDQNPDITDSVVWEVIDAARWSENHLCGILECRDLRTAPPNVIEALRERTDPRLKRSLVENSTWELDTSMPVRELLSSDRGEEFLEDNAPSNDRSVWDALRDTWSGSVDDLLTATQELGADA